MSGNGESLRVLLADDHPLYRCGLRMMLSTLGAEIVAEATTGESAITGALEHRPDIIVMDINMPVLNGIEATRRIVEQLSGARVLILTMFEDDEPLFAAMRAGALGYVVKGAGEEEIVRAVRAVAAGEAIFSPSIAQRVIRYFSHIDTRKQSAFPELSDREREILELIAAGHANQSIARKLFVSEKTVRNHVSNIFTKLQVADRSEAIVRARREGFGEGKQ